MSLEQAFIKEVAIRKKIKELQFMIVSDFQTMRIIAERIISLEQNENTKIVKVDIVI